MSCPSLLWWANECQEQGRMSQNRRRMKIMLFCLFYIWWLSCMKSKGDIFALDSLSRQTVVCWQSCCLLFAAAISSASVAVHCCTPTSASFCCWQQVVAVGSCSRFYLLLLCIFSVCSQIQSVILLALGCCFQLNEKYLVALWTLLLSLIKHLALIEGAISTGWRAQHCKEWCE